MNKEILKEANLTLKEIETLEGEGDFKQAGIAKAYFTEMFGETLVEQVERVQSLELENNGHLETISNYETINKQLHDRRRELREQNKRYRGSVATLLEEWKENLNETKRHNEAYYSEYEYKAGLIDGLKFAIDELEGLE